MNEITWQTFQPDYHHSVELTAGPGGAMTVKVSSVGATPALKLKKERKESKLVYITSNRSNKR
jgi:hypothetical protein